MGAARRVYRLLLRAYPAELRERDGAEMEAAFLHLLRRDRLRHGWPGVGRCWAGAVADVARSAGVAWWRRLVGMTTTTGGGFMETLRWDVRLAVRTLVRRPLFALTAVSTLAVGIGANASVFTLADGLLWTPLPYEEPEELVTLWEENAELGWFDTDVGPADAWDWRARASTLDGLAVFWEDRLNLVGDGPPEIVEGIRATPDLLPLLGVEPALGRGFAPDEMGEGRTGVTVITHGFWQRRLGGDPDALGTTLSLDGEPRTVVGILPPDFRFLDEVVDLFLPLPILPTEADRDGHYAEALGRLAPDATLASARTELAAIAAALAEEHPDANRGWTVTVRSTHEELLGDMARQAALILLAAVGLVLLMVCVNLANLTLARASGRRSEMAVRSALGADRTRLARQLLTESAVLAVLGGAAGWLVALWGHRAMVALLPSNLPPVFEFGMDGSVLAFVTGLTLLSALLFGTVPALRSSRLQGELLRTGGRAGPGRAGRRFGSSLVVTQTALALVLLVGGGLLMKSIAAMRSQDLGFDPENVLTVRVSPPGASYDGPEALRTFWAQVEDRVRALPEVAAVATTQSHPLMGSNWGSSVRLPWEPDRERSVRTTWVSPGYFRALGYEVLRGRVPDARDGPDAPEVAVVNQAFVDQLVGEGTDPLSVTLMGGEEGEIPIQVVGVVGNAVERDVDVPPEPTWYRPMDQTTVWSRSLVVRTRGEPTEALPAVQEAVWTVDPDLPLYAVETMAELVERRVASFAAVATLMGVFALLSLLMGAVGIYGVTAYAAGQRTGEIGVRLAMGADRADVTRMVVLEGARRTALGIVVGLVAALGLARLLEGILVGVEPWDPAVFAAVAGVLVTVSFLGLWLPARRAARVDPVQALAAE